MILCAKMRTRESPKKKRKYIGVISYYMETVCMDEEKRGPKKEEEEEELKLGSKKG